MKTDNMSIWSQVEKTAPEATRAAKVNGQQITSISGHHMVKRATEVFGPVGIGWGWTVAEERFDQGGEIRNDKGEIIGHEVGHTIRIRLWFMQDGKHGEVEQYGCTPFTYKSKWGVTTDTEAPKKSLTDAIKKALSMLGFSADIFLGMYDDTDYVQQRQAEAALEQAENREAELERQKQERLEWLKASVEALDTATTLHELKKLHTHFVRAATRRQETAFVERLGRAFKEREQNLQENDK